MTADTVVVQGTLNSDGRLDLSGRITLPPGPVEVTVRAVARAEREDLNALLARIRTEQRASGHRPRTAEEIDADIRQMRDEWEAHQLGIEKLQEECRRDRVSTPPEPPA